MQEDCDFPGDVPAETLGRVCLDDSALLVHISNSIWKVQTTQPESKCEELDGKATQSTYVKVTDGTTIDPTKHWYVHYEDKGYKIKTVVHKNSKTYVVLNTHVFSLEVGTLVTRGNNNSQHIIIEVEKPAYVSGPILTSLTGRSTSSKTNRWT